LAGVLLLSILFKYLAIMDQSDMDREQLEAQQQQESKSGYYFLTEKQVAEADAHVPLLLSCEDDDDEEEERQKLYADDHDDLEGAYDASLVSSSDSDLDLDSDSEDGSQIAIVVA